MKILFLAPTPFYSVRGTPIRVFNILRQLSERGHEVDLLTFPIGNDVELAGLKIIRCGKLLPFREISLGPSLKKMILDFAIFLNFFFLLVRAYLQKNMRYDCIHSLDELSLGCFLVKRLIKCPVIYQMDSSIVEQFDANRRYRYFTNFAST